MSKNNSSCCVPQCNSWIKRNPTLSFHTFPKLNSEQITIESKFGTRQKIDRRALWIDQLKMERNPSPYMRVCSLHFSDTSFFKGTKFTRLKKGTYPTQNLPKSTVITCDTSSTYNRKARSKRKQIAFETVELPSLKYETVELPSLNFETVQLPSLKFETVDLPSLTDAYGQHCIKLEDESTKPSEDEINAANGLLQLDCRWETKMKLWNSYS